MAPWTHVLLYAIISALAGAGVRAILHRLAALLEELAKLRLTLTELRALRQITDQLDTRTDGGLGEIRRLLEALAAQTGSQAPRGRGGKRGA